MEEQPLPDLVEPEPNGVEPMPSEPNVPSGLTYQLRFEQFKQIATLAVAAAGGVLILLQAGYVESTFKSGAVVAAFALSASLALFGQDKLVEGLEAGKGRTQTARLLLFVSFALLGAGIGVLIQLVI